MNEEIIPEDSNGGTAEHQSSESTRQDNESFSETDAQEIIRCKACDAKFQEPMDFCSNCGFPFNGTDEEKGKFIGQYLSKKREASDVHQRTRVASNTLFAIAGLTVLGGLIVSLKGSMYKSEQIAFIIEIGVFAILFMGLGFWARINPLPAIITGLTVYVLIYAVQGFIDPEMFFKGILIKGIILAFLIRGVTASLQAKKLKEEGFEARDA